jgi:hypothetical protein
MYIGLRKHLQHSLSRAVAAWMPGGPATGLPFAAQPHSRRSISRCRPGNLAEADERDDDRNARDKQASARLPLVSLGIGHRTPSGPSSGGAVTVSFGNVLRTVGGMLRSPLVATRMSINVLLEQPCLCDGASIVGR